MHPQISPLQNPNNAYPECLLPSLRDVDFVCPLCRGKMGVLKNGYQCSHCQKNYHLHDGIPDFRVFPDPYLSYEEDRERTEIVLAALEKFNLEKLLEHYWSFSDITPENLRPKFIRSVMLGEQKAERMLELFDNGTFKKPVVAKRVLEIGSGTGNFLAVATSRYEQVIGVDIAMRWLHVSRRRFMDKGLPVPPLVCCCAEFLPFADKSFDLVVAISTIEFVRDQDKVFAECSRALEDDGSVYINSVNRYSVARDPYSYLWGVGFLPRALQASYVRWRRKASYENIRTLSYCELNHKAGAYFPSRELGLPDISSSVLREFSPITRFQTHVYKFLRQLSVFSNLLKWTGPGWDVVLRKTSSRESNS